MTGYLQIKFLIFIETTQNYAYESDFWKKHAVNNAFQLECNVSLASLTTRF